MSSIWELKEQYINLEHEINKKKLSMEHLTYLHKKFGNDSVESRTEQKINIDILRLQIKQDKIKLLRMKQQIEQKMNDIEIEYVNVLRLQS